MSDNPGREVIDQALIDDVCKRIATNREVTFDLPYGGKVHIDRQLPFLCLYRRPAKRSDPGTDRLVLAEASYIIADERLCGFGLEALVEAIVETAAKEFGAFLLTEIFSLPESADDTESIEEELEETFCLFTLKKGVLSPVVERLKNLLSRMQLNHIHPKVSLRYTQKIAPPGMQPVLSSKVCAQNTIHMLGVGVKPIYQSEEGTLYPMELEHLRREMSVALKKAFFVFVRNYTTMLMVDYRELGRRGVTEAVFRIDDALAKIEESFDFLLQVSPVNTHEAWRGFQKSRYSVAPRFYYRPRPFDPALKKRELFLIELEQIEDPVLSDIFTQKRDEIDRKLTMLSDRETPAFLPGSLQVYGGVEPSLLEIAKAMMDAIASVSVDPAPKETVDAVEMARAARREIAWYKTIYPDMNAKVEVRDDIASGAMVSNGNFLINRHSTFAKRRVEALIHHEIGTHVVTYYNGLSQPFKQLHTGLCGYDEMQEGIAVLAEYLCGGLTLSRLRTLAARVIAVDSMVREEGFVTTFARLHEGYGIGAKTAFGIVSRVYRGGGLTKDAVYLRGLLDVLRYIHEGGKLDLLFIGKIAASHIPLVQELLYRKILHQPPLFPRYLETKEAQRRLQKIREGLGVLDMITKELS